MEYQELSLEDFDALVTGELTHYAIWLEGAVGQIIMDYFLINTSRRADFERLMLFRDGLTFQDKIEIARAMIPLLEPVAGQVELNRLLNEVEEFKGWRNALAHGLTVDAVGHPGPIIRVETVGRSGRPRVLEITPDSHRKRMDEAEALLKRLKDARTALCKGVL